MSISNSIFLNYCIIQRDLRRISYQAIISLLQNHYVFPLALKMSDLLLQPNFPFTSTTSYISLKTDRHGTKLSYSCRIQGNDCWFRTTAGFSFNRKISLITTRCLLGLCAIIVYRVDTLYLYFLLVYFVETSISVIRGLHLK